MGGERHARQRCSVSEGKGSSVTKRRLKVGTDWSDDTEEKCTERDLGVYYYLVSFSTLQIIVVMYKAIRKIERQKELSHLYCGWHPLKE